MRKIADSGKCSHKVRLSAWAEARSRPNGFSITKRAPSLQDSRESSFITDPNAFGGIAR